MNSVKYLEKHLFNEIHAMTEKSPDQLRDALFYAVIPGGGRVRPILCLEVVSALSPKVGTAALGAATAVELIHAASLVHDDMPCFDNADIRRGKPSVHRRFGERIALLTGDGLIAAAFEVLWRNAADHPRFGEMVRVLAQAIGPSNGLVSGQAWEDQPNARVDVVHERKTGALFTAAAVMGALVAGAEPDPWRELGRALGAAYQVADDILDAAGSVTVAGKPVGQDERREVASLVLSSGLTRAVSKFLALVEDAVATVPECDGKARLQALVRNIAARLCPKELMDEYHNEKHSHGDNFYICSVSATG